MGNIMDVLDDSGLPNVLATTAVLALLLYCMGRFNAYLNDLHIPIRDASKTHNWLPLSQLPQSCICSICETWLITIEGYYCDSCGVCADPPCIKKANKLIKCKEVSTNGDGPLKHRWMKGNLPAGSTCIVCAEECCLDPGLVDFQCIWCQFCVHKKCLSSFGDVCNYGKFKNFIVPPTHLTVKKYRMGNKLRLKALTDPGWNDWTPLFVIANCKSGNNRGGLILSMFRRALNPAQVVDLSQRPPSSMKEWFNLLPPSAKPILLIAGGDGTVAWVLTTLQQLGISPSPPVGVIPLGTGNDLSRFLGWGKEEPADISPSLMLSWIQSATPIQLDRWAVNIHHIRQMGLPRPSHLHFMYNYLSVGVDAQVTLNFHRTRQAFWYNYVLSSRFVNKFLYLIFGTQQVVEKCCAGLEERLELFMDGVRIDLPAIESIVVLNIPYWGAGVPLWTINYDSDSEDDHTDNSFAPQSVNDGKLEVVAIYSSFHIAQLQVGLSQPLRLGQAKEVIIKLKDSAPIQVDGEPWIQLPSDISIKHENQACLLQLEDY